MTTFATEVESPLSRLSAEQIDELGRELDAIRDRVHADLGERDRALHREHDRDAAPARGARRGRCCSPPAIARPGVAGTAALSVAKILENMEIGHNVLHGQWDWMNDPRINSSTWDWDNASTAEAWKHSHNYVHHTFANIRGKDKDLGYEIMRIDPHQRWHPVYLFQPLYNLLLMAFFEWGVALARPRLRGDPQGHEVEGPGEARAEGDSRQGEEPDRQGLRRLAAAERCGDGRARCRRGRAPSLAGRHPPASPARWPGSRGWKTPCESAPGRIARPRQRTPPPTWSATSGPTRSSSAATSPTRPTPSAPGRSRTRAAAAGTCARWSGRRTSRAARCSTSPAATSATRSSTTSSRILPSTRYAEVAPQVKDICERYGLPYNSGPFLRAARDGPADDPAARLPGREAAPEAGAVPRRAVRFAIIA